MGPCADLFSDVAGAAGRNVGGRSVDGYGVGHGSRPQIAWWARPSQVAAVPAANMSTGRRSGSSTSKSKMQVLTAARSHLAASAVGKHSAFAVSAGVPTNSAMSGHARCNSSAASPQRAAAVMNRRSSSAPGRLAINAAACCAARAPAHSRANSPLGSRPRDRTCLTKVHLAADYLQPAVRQPTRTPPAARPWTTLRSRQTSLARTHMHDRRATLHFPAHFHLTRLALWGGV